jgi:hypothetical protein
MHKKSPFGIELRGVAEVHHHVAGDMADAHLRPQRALAGAGIGDLAQQRDHAQLLQQHGVERDLVQPVEDVARRVRRARPLDRIDLYEVGVVRATLAH